VTAHLAADAASAVDPAAIVPGPRAQLLGVPVSVVTEVALLDAVNRAVDSRRPTVFVGLYASLFRGLGTDPRYRGLVARSITYPDGQGVVTELRKRGVADAERLATTDVVHPIVRLAARRGWRVGLYGAAPGVAERAAVAVSSGVPGLTIAGAWDGFSGTPTAAELRAAGVDVLFVALGAGRQERWAYEVAAAAGVPAVLTCGGLFDFLAGDKRRAPYWMQRAGLEWVFRILLEPRRLFRRYLLGNTHFLLAARRDRGRVLPGGRPAERPLPAGSERFEPAKGSLTL